MIDKSKIDISKYITKEEVCQELKISKSLFEKEIQNKLIYPKFKKGKYLFYLRDDILNIKKQNNELIKDYIIIKGFDSYYINIYGDIISFKCNIKPIKLKYKIDKDGYYSVCLFQDGIRYFKRINRLVAETFIPNPDNKTEVNHKDGDKHNNFVNNLEWSTTSENIKHAFANGLNHTGIKNVKSSPVIAYKNNGEIHNIYENILRCAEDIGVNEATVRDSHKNKTTKGHCGYYFRRISKEEYFKLKVSQNEKYEN